VFAKSDGCAVEVRVVGHQAGDGMRGGAEVAAADLGGLGHEGAVVGIGGPARPQFVEGGQVVGRIGELAAAAGGDEDDLFLLPVKHRGDGIVAVVAVVEHVAEEGLRLSLVVEDALAVAPAVGGEEERHDEPLLAIGGRAVAHAGAVIAALPAVVACEAAVGVVHVAPGPLPDAVELGLFIHLHGEHHAVGLAFGAHVLVFDVGDVGHPVCGGVEETLGGGVADGELVPDGLEFGVEFGLSFAEVLGEEIPVLAGFEGGGGRGRDESAQGERGAQEDFFEDGHEDTARRETGGRGCRGTVRRVRKAVPSARVP